MLCTEQRWRWGQNVWTPIGVWSRSRHASDSLRMAAPRAFHAYTVCAYTLYRAQVAMELKRAGQFISRTLSYEVRCSRACNRALHLHDTTASSGVGGGNGPACQHLTASMCKHQHRVLPRVAQVCEQPNESEGRNHTRADATSNL